MRNARERERSASLARLIASTLNQFHTIEKLCQKGDVDPMKLNSHIISEFLESEYAEAAVFLKKA